MRPILAKITILSFICLSFTSCKERQQLCFSYSSSLSQGEMQTLEAATTTLSIGLEDLTRWDEAAKEVLAKYPMPATAGETRLFAYLYQAQERFANESFYITGSYSGSLDPISIGIIRLFYPDELPNLQIKTDPFSDLLSTFLMRSFAERYREEEQALSSATVSERAGKWLSLNPIGVKYSSMKPWALSSPSEYRTPDLPPSDDPFWQEQIQQVQQKVTGVTNSQLETIDFWARANLSFFWLSQGQDYMTKQATSLAMQLHVRQKLATALIDSLIASFESKFTHLIERPSQKDSQIRTTISPPPTPSYPSTHSTMSAAASLVLSYYFPENRTVWTHLAEEAGISRIWAGVHYPVDNSSGQHQGFEVGRAVLFRMP